VAAATKSKAAVDAAAAAALKSPGDVDTQAKLLAAMKTLDEELTAIRAVRLLQARAPGQCPPTTT
jgi:hypothetical protein